MEGDRTTFFCLDCGYENKYTVEQLIGRLPLTCKNCKSINVQRDSHARHKKDWQRKAISDIKLAKRHCP